MRKLILSQLVGLLFFGIVNAQVDIKQVGYHKVMVADTLYSQHSQEYQAQEMQLNLELQGIQSKIILAEKIVTISDNFWESIVPDTVHTTTLEYVYDTIYLQGETEVRYLDMIEVNGEDYKVSEIEYMLPKTLEDTLTLTECFEDYNDKIWLWDTPDHVWIPFKETGLSHVKVDSMPVWKKKYQQKYKVQRIKDYANARTEYVELEMPFQFMNDSIVLLESESIRLRIFANEDWYPMLYVEDQLWQDLSEAVPGYQDFDGFEMRRHTITFTGLLPDTEYTLKVVGHSRLRKEEDIIYFNVKTLP